MKKILSILLSLTLFLPISVISVNAQEATITIYHTNDVHGYVDVESSSIGLARVASLKKSDPNSILVDAGDATQGMPIASITKGQDIIKLMNLVGYDAMVAGNHEFDFGVENFLTNKSLASFPVLTSNILYNGSALSDEQIIIEKNGKKIGFFGLTTTETSSATNPEGIVGVEFLDEVSTAQKQVESLKAQNCDAIIALTHMGDGPVPCTSKQLAEQVDGIDVIIDGHSHTVENETIKNTYITQTGSSLNSVGKVTLQFSENDVSVQEGVLLSKDYMTAVEPDAEVQAKIDAINNEQAAVLSQQIGTTSNTLWAGWIGNVAPTRIVETNFGNLATDAYHEKASSYIQTKGEDIPVVAVENGGGIREKVSNGAITKGQLVAAFPFSNTLYMKKVTPYILYEMMNVSSTLMDGQDTETGMLLQQKISGGFLQVSGMSVVYDPNSENRVTSITLNGQNEALDRNDNVTEILLVSNNYIMSGGSDYAMLKDIDLYGELGGELETVEAYVSKTDLSKYATTEKRIQYLGTGYTPKEYVAHAYVTDKSGNMIQNQEIEVIVDGNEVVKGTVDENGLLSVLLSDGAHSIRLDNESSDILVDNYLGFGIVEDAIRGSYSTLMYTKEIVDPVPETPEIPEEPELPEEPEQDKEEPKKDPTSNKENANTGVQNYTLMYAGIGVVCLVGIVILVILTKKKK